MTAFQKNGYIDLSTSNPVGSANQVLNLSGGGMQAPVQITLENGRISHVTMNGVELDSSRYKIHSVDGKSTVVFPEFDMHVGIHPDKVTVGATHRVDQDGNPTNFLFTFNASGAASYQSAPDRNPRPAQPAAPADSAHHVQVVRMEDTESRMERIQRNNRSAENRQNWLNFNADGSMKYDSSNDQDFRSALVGYNANNTATDFLMSRRDESYQRFSAIIDGVKGTIDMNCYRDNHWIANSTAEFYAPDGSHRHVDIEQALQARGETLRRLHVQDVSSHDPNFSCGLPSFLEAKMGLKR